MKKIFKKFLTVACVMAMTLGLSGVVNAAENGNLKTGITWRIEGNTLIFSGNGSIGEYNTDYDPANIETLMPSDRINALSGHNVKTEIRKVVLENGITDIGVLAFDGFLSMEEIVIPASVKHIGFLAMAGDTRLKTITFEGTQKEWDSIDKVKGWNRIYDGVYENVASIKSAYKENGLKVSSVPKNIKASAVKCTKTGLTISALEIMDGETKEVSLPEGSKVSVKSTNSKAVKVKYNKKTGKISVTAKNPGTAKVNVKAGKVTESFYVTVNAAPFVLSKVDVKLGVKGTDTVTVPANTKATVKPVNKKIATAKYNKKKGEIKITGKKPGNTQVTVKVGNETKTINVTVE